jgi:predicted PurR-regulated permease PerM
MSGKAHVSGAVKTIGRSDVLGSNVIDSLVRLSVLVLVIYWCFLLVQPFFVLMTWSVVLVIVLYPLYSWSIRRCHLPSAIAAGLIVVLCLMVLLGPVTWLGLSLGASVSSFAQRLMAGKLAISPPFESLKEWPLVGAKAYDLWHLASTNLQGAMAKVAPHLRPLGSYLLVFASGAGLSMLKFAAAIVAAGFLFGPGLSLARSAGVIFRHLTPEHGDEYVHLVGVTVRNLARGVIGVAILQSLLVGIGVIVAGLPAAGLISLAVLILSIIQVGSAIVVVPVVAWSFFTMDATAATLFALYMLPVSLIDNVLRPIIMSHGLKTPMLIMLIGLLGGVWVHGLIGLFVGPIVLAIGWELFGIWMKLGEAEAGKGVAEQN